MFIIANFHSSQIYLVQSAVLYVRIYFTLRLNFLNKYIQPCNMLDKKKHQKIDKLYNCPMFCPYLFCLIWSTIYYRCIPNPGPHRQFFLKNTWVKISFCPTKNILSGPAGRAPENIKLAGNWPKLAAMCSF